MSELVLIGATALLASGLTLFSGFGLGTLLMPVFALFFPVAVAIAATAVVHLANNLFKLALLARLADWRVVLRFGGLRSRWRAGSRYRSRMRPATGRLRHG